MKTKTILTLFLIILLCASVASFSKDINLSKKEQNQRIKNLSEKYKNWYDMITYISTKKERMTFLSLNNDKDRELFIQTFWLQRDPTPGTTENEFEIEIKKRFIYVNDYFKRGSSKPGWMTDMGKFYMILGKPNTIERFPSSIGLYPAQIWYYFGDKRLNLPTYFSILFFKPYNTTEWKLFNPAAHNPADLLITNTPVDRENYSDLYNKIHELAPTLAKAAVSMIPSERRGDFTPSLSANLILNNIYISPVKKINVSYATNFLNYKGYVDVDSSVNFIEAIINVSVSKYGRLPFSFVNISLQPKKVSVAYSKEKDKYYFNFELSVSLKQGEMIVFQYSKNYDFNVEPDQVGSISSNGIVIHDFFPAIPGRYQLNVFAKNTVGKEFTFFEKEIDIKPEKGIAYLGTPVVGYKTDKQFGNEMFPYKFNNQKIFITPDNNFKLNANPVILIGVYNLNRELWQKGRVKLVLKGLNERNKFKEEQLLELSKFEYKENLNIVTQLSKQQLFTDYYEYSVQLLNKSGIIIDTKGSELSVSPTVNKGYPSESFKKARLDSIYRYYYLLGLQHKNSGRLKAAEEMMETAIGLNPGFSQGYVEFLEVLNLQKKYTKVLVEAEKIKTNKKISFDYHYHKGYALFGMKDYQKALDELLKANKIYNSDPRVLNLLGFTFANLKNYEEAVKALESSLLLNDDQKMIKRTLSSIRKQINQKDPDRK